MPLAPRYSWSETELDVSIQLHSLSLKDQGQLLCGDSFVKISAAPYFLLLDLFSEVDECSSHATIQGSTLILKLRKKTAGLWGQLTAGGDKESMKQRRVASIERAYQRQAAAAEQRAKRKQQEERDAVDRRIALDRQRRDTIEARRQQELANERQQLQQWQSSLMAGASNDQAGAGDESDYEDEDEEAEHTAQSPIATPNQQQQRQQQEQKQLQAQEHTSSEQQVQQEQSDEMRSYKSRPVGQPGAAGASMPSSHPDYYGRGWWPQRDQGSRGRNPGGDSSGDDDEPPGRSGGVGDGKETGRAAEEGEGGDEQVQGAAEGSWDTGVDGGGSESDGGSSGGQEVMPVAPRRGSLAPVKVSFTPLETAHLPARQDREEEIRLHKKGCSSQVAGDSVDIADRQPAFLKDKGDALFKQGNYRGALNAYSRALLLEPPHPSPLLANRAACHFKLGDAAACRTDCSAALEMVRGQLGSLEEVGGLVSACNSGAHASREHVHSVDGRPQGEAIRGEQSETASQQLPQGSMKDQPAAETAADEAPPAPRQPTTAAPVAPAAAAPETEGERLRRLLTKLLARRAAASAQLGELVVAEQDLVEALRFDPTNARLVADLGEVRAAASAAAAVSTPAVATPAGATQDQGGCGSIGAGTCVQPPERTAGATAPMSGAAAAAAGAAVAATARAGKAVEMAAVWARAEARFRAGDYEGAAEAYGAVLQAQADPNSRSDSIRALSNRAACWLPLERYKDCLSDCCAALSMLLPEIRATGPLGDAAESAGADAAGPESADGAEPVSASGGSADATSDCTGAMPSQSHGVAVAAATSSGSVGAAGHQGRDGALSIGVLSGEQQVGARQQRLQGEPGSSEDGCPTVVAVVKAAHQALSSTTRSSSSSGSSGGGNKDAVCSRADGGGGGIAAAGHEIEQLVRTQVVAAARLVARMALASGCLKRVQAASGLYQHAVELYGLVGEEGQVKRLRDDERKLLAMTINSRV